MEWDCSVKWRLLQHRAPNVGFSDGLQRIADCVLVTCSTLGGKSLKVCWKEFVSVIIIIKTSVLRYSTCPAQKYIFYAAYEGGQNIVDSIGTGCVLEGTGSYQSGGEIFLTPAEQPWGLFTAQ
jgi:hypothetical protein